MAELVAVAEAGAVAVAKKLRCWVGWHRWVQHVNDEGQRFWRCAECDKFRDSGGASLHDVLPPPGVSG
jgi:hypothetical protein